MVFEEAADMHCTFAPGRENAHCSASRLRRFAALGIVDQQSQQILQRGCLSVRQGSEQALLHPGDRRLHRVCCSLSGRRYPKQPAPLVLRSHFAAIMRSYRRGVWTTPMSQGKHEKTRTSAK